MNGETRLSKLLASMSPQLMANDYVFCTFPNASYGDYAELQPVAAMAEAEGLTLIVPKHKARAHGCEFESVFKQITLNVHSSLDAVGLTAAFSKKLSQCGMSANVVAGYYHDHIFVQSEIAEAALAALKELAVETGRQLN